MNKYMENKIIGIVELNSDLNERARERNSVERKQGDKLGRKVFWFFI